MSTLWTPGGEVPLGDGRSDAGPERSDAPKAGAGAAAGDEFDLDSLSPQERERAEQYLQELAESRERLKEAPASVVVANHAMGLYELAALHLADQQPNLAEATVAIDALGALLDGMKGRLGEPEPTLRDALSQIRMAFVHLKNRPADPDGEAVGSESADDETAARAPQDPDD